jgi:hypothetical protein
MFKIIGDVHSRNNALEKALKDNPGCTNIFLGDILDGRMNLDEKEQTRKDLLTLNLVLDKADKIILGNHEVNLLTNLAASKLTTRTHTRLQDYRDFNLFKTTLRHVGRTFLDLEIENQVYHLAHAYPFKHALEREQVYGIKQDGIRQKWYKNYHGSEFKICGHYHEIKLEHNLCVLDGDSESEECVPVLLIDNKNNKRLLRYYD